MRSHVPGLRRRKRRLLAVATAVLVGGVLGSATPALALSSDVVISQVYGNGGGADTFIKHDFIELANTSDAPVDMSSWSVQYASAAGVVFQTTSLNGTIPARGYYLVREAAGAGGVAGPVPDAIGTIPMSATSGVVALVTAQYSLAGCGTLCATAPNVKDLVGYGATANVETLAAPGLTNITALLRACAPLDTDDNAVDFGLATPNPRNSTATGMGTDCTGPTATIAEGDGQNDPAFDDPVHFKVTASEPLRSLTSADLVVSGGTGAAVTGVTQLSPLTYDVAVGGMTNSNAVVLSIPGFLTDVAGNVSSAAPNPGSIDFAFPPPCNLGFYSASGRAPCTAAGIGFYVDFNGATSPSPCPTGTTTTATASTSVAACIPITVPPAFGPATPSLTATVGQPYGATFVATGTPAPTYAPAPGAPSWLTVDPSTGLVSGTPPAGTSSFTYSVVAANGVAPAATAGPFTVAVTTPPPPSTKADVSAGLSCPSSARVNATVTCTYTVRNAGPAAAKSVVAVLTVPTTLGITSLSSGGTSFLGLASWKVPSLASGASVTFTVTARARSAGKAPLAAAVAAANPDPNWRNNLAATSIIVTR